MNPLLQNLMQANQPEGGEPAFEWSPLQKAVFSEVLLNERPICVDAKAGAAKTTTLVHAAGLATQPSIFLAFNKSIAEEIRGRLKKGEAKTINALGHRLWMSNCPRARLDARKTESLIEKLLPDEQRRKFGYLIQRLISAAKSGGLGLESESRPGDFSHSITNGDWDVDDGDVEEVALWANRVFLHGQQDTATFDFDDQIYGPVLHRWEFPHFPTVMVDEAQDLNRIQHLFIEELARNGRLIAVGDPNQAIYGFRGALSDSMDLLVSHFRMRTLPLSISYRCSQAVIRQAQTLVPDISAREGAPEGQVVFETDSDPELFPEGMLVMCRNNAPLFAAIMRHVRARRPCRVLSNALDGLASFIKKARRDDIQGMLKWVDRWEARERFAAESKHMDWKVASIQDKADTVRALSEGFTEVGEVLALLRQLQEGRTGPIFSTIHKAKGLEAEHAWLIRPDLLRPWWVKEEAALQQEDNLHYVAITRAKLTFTYGARKS